MIGFGVEDDRFWGVTIAIGDDESGSTIGDDESMLRLRLRLRSRSARRQSRTAKSKGKVERRRRTAKSKGAIRSRTMKSKSNSSALWVRSLSRCDLSGRSLAGRRGVLSPSLFFLYLTLTQLSLSLSIFRKIVFEGKIKTKINLHPTHGQLKTISEKCIFHVQPNTRKYGKAFPEVIFTQNKHRVSFNIYHSKKKNRFNIKCIMFCAK